ncbi:endoglucanase ii [Colletotrichum kahawae]|uniref:lytic cellulose monooxygenase (C4-dehydrogenating) n=1 Tax=Colletotrichum kahawae TaxID=34407 RepID=A0AAD9XXC4_COLKA|nr:endoglucanase ii [Colletotrichum kahawae]
MKFLPLFFTLATTANAHSIFQRLAIDGVDQGQLKGIRAPEDTSPITNVNDADLACNKNLIFLDESVIAVPAGVSVGTWWGHVIGGAIGPGDEDQPIADSHKGPIMAYLAKVDNAAKASSTGLSWFKIAESGLRNNQWATDNLRADDGWFNFTMPSCVASGDYLMRVEIIALHEAFVGMEQPQFYMECAQIRVEGSGTNTGVDFAEFPGAYQLKDPGIVFGIYDDNGGYDPTGKTYSIPGPKVLTW